MQWPVLRPGSSGEAVRLLQIQLNAIAAIFSEYRAVGSAGGNFGPNTEAAVRHLQRVENIAVDSSVGPETRARILALLNKMAQQRGRAFMPQYNVREWLISGKNRPGVQITPKFITVHQTGNPRAGANAAAHRNYAQNNDRQVSYQWVVDDREAILCVPENEVAWHAGRDANYNSIAIEICENEDADKDLIYSVAVHRIASIALDNNFNLDQIRTHQSWTGKTCPHQLIPVFHQMLADIGATMEAIIASQQPEPPMEPEPPTEPDPPQEPEPPAEPEPPQEPEPPAEPETPGNWLTRLVSWLISVLFNWLRRRSDRESAFTSIELAWIISESLAEDIKLLNDDELISRRQFLQNQLSELQTELKPFTGRSIDTYNEQ
ncbi:MAG: hypothetical protein FH749_00795 [Firmicutes bacterium]|nr:hypothetical protein [Bacillota bacterium]